MTLRVYGRTEYAEPLVEVGSVERPDDVRTTYDGDWVELIAFPEAAVHWIVREGREVDDG